MGGPSQVKFLTIPNAITLASLNLGAFSLYESLHDGTPAALGRAALAIAGGAACDFFDGRVARALHEQNPLGAQLDSLADFVSFGLAPAALMYATGLSRFGLLGAAACALYATATAMRLARFNLKADEGPSSHFQGMPSSAAGVTATASALVAGTGDVRLLALAALLALLMVSNARVPSFKLGFPKVLGPVAAVVVLPIAFVFGPAAGVLAAMLGYLGLAALDTARGATDASPAARPVPAAAER